MSLFYAYAKYVNDNFTYRYVIVFATRAVADEWWRAVSTSTNTNFANSIQRITPQFYTHDVLRANIADSLTTASVATQFLGRVFFTIIGNRDVIGPTVIPVQNVKDHISNGWFYIRSNTDPTIFWHRSPQNIIVASTTHRSRFRIRAADNVPDGAVMIGSDDIFITVDRASDNVGIDTNGDLITTGRTDRIKFKDFNDGFRIGRGSSSTVHRPTATISARLGPNDSDKDDDGVVSPASGSVNITVRPENIIVKTASGDGESWELV